MITPNIGEKIIIALDVPDSKKAFKLVDELKDHVGAFKIGLQLFTAEGRALVEKLVKDGVKIFLDVKFFDIPNTVAKASIEVARMGVWMFNVHALGGTEMMKKSFAEMTEFCEKEKIERPLMIGVTVLTSGDDAWRSEVGLERTVAAQVRHLALNTKIAGLDGVVSSVHEASQIREAVNDANFKIVTPGIRAASGTFHDQKRVANISEALKNGSDYLVIGRAVTDSENPLNALNLLCSDV